MKNADWKTADAILELQARNRMLEDEVLRLTYRNEAMQRAGDEMADTLNSTYSVEVREANLRDWRAAKAASITPADPIYRKFLLAELELRRKTAAIIEAGFDLRWYLDGSEASVKAKELWDKAVLGMSDKGNGDEGR